MIPVNSINRIYLYSGPCDMRKSFDSLCGLVRTEMGADPLSGSLFVFCNRRRNMVKMLYWDSDGFAIWYKRLEKGTFSLPVIHGTGGIIERRQLYMLLEGVLPEQMKKRYIFSK